MKLCKPGFVQTKGKCVSANLVSIQAIYGKDPLVKYGEPEIKFKTKIYDTRQRDYLGAQVPSLEDSEDKGTKKLWEQFTKHFQKLGFKDVQKEFEAITEGHQIPMTFKVSDLFEPEETQHLIIEASPEDKLIARAHDLELV